jgi:hypothetical protein
VRYTTFKERKQNFGYEDSQAVPTRPFGKGRLKRSKAFRSGDGRANTNGARREVEHGH